MNLGFITGPQPGGNTDNYYVYDDDSMGGSPGELSEELVTQEKRNKGRRMNCDVGDATAGLENEL